jgi:two-component system, OmpR family, sensor kinase
VSLRARVALLTFAALAVALVIIGVAVPTLIRRFLTDRLDERLEAGRVAALAQVGDMEELLPRDVDASDVSLEIGSLYLERRTRDGRYIDGGYLIDSTAPRQEPDLPSVLDRAAGDTFNVDGAGAGPSTSFRVHVTESVYPDELVVAALPTTDIDATVERVVLIEIVVSGVVLAVLAVAVWGLVGVGLRPLRRMEATAEAITGGDFAGAERERSRVPHPSARTEIGRLGATLNEMLDSIDRAFDARQRSEAKLRRFVADASHELRTPLTSIRGYAELYRRGGDDPRQVARSIERIEAEATRMSGIVEDLLLLAHLDEGRPLARQPVELGRLATALVADARAVDPSRVWAIDAPRPVTVTGDRNRLTQVVANLVANARLHATAGTPVEVHVSVVDATARVDVVDHGRGLDADAKARVFDRFYRVDHGRSRRHGGSGLGLSIAAAVVNAHGGMLTVTDTPGGGATFSVQLPAG